MKRDRIIYYISTGLITLVMLFSAFNYFFNHEMVAGFFESFGYPTYIIYPLGIAKVLGLIAIWTRKSETLKEWAYAGFFFDLILATGAHYAISDGQHFLPIIALILLLVSYMMQKRIFTENPDN